MQHAVVSFPLKEGRRLNDPCHPNNCSFVGLVPMHEVWKFAPKDGGGNGQVPWVNPRLFDPDPIKNKNKMAKEIFLSAQNEDNLGKFHYLNRGITLVADMATLDNGIF